MLEAVFGYRRIHKLSDPAAVHGEPIASVAIVDVYGPLLRDLADIASGNAGAPRKAFHPLGYDWRIDLRDAAADVARRIDALPAEDLADITIVGHSMGCLVARLIWKAAFTTSDRGSRRSRRSWRWPGPTPAPRPR